MLGHIWSFSPSSGTRAVPCLLHKDGPKTVAKPLTRNDAAPLRLCVGRVCQPLWEGSCLHVGACGPGGAQHSLPQYYSRSCTQVGFIQVVHWSIGSQQSAGVKMPFSMHKIVRDVGLLAVLSRIFVLSLDSWGETHICDENGGTNGHFSSVSGAIMLTVT